MEIPYTVTARPDTGLWNAKVGIWLFLASEVMLFGGLFSAYIFLRLDAQPGYWPHGLLNVPVGTMNTAILIASSVTVVLAWASLKMRRLTAYKVYMGITILCGVLFLVVKLAYEWPQKFEHFGAYIKPSALEKYEQYLGNKHLLSEGLPPRVEITGHLHNHEAMHDPKIKEYEVGLDSIYTDPTNPAMDRPHFLFVPPTEKMAQDRQGRCGTRDHVCADAQHLFCDLLYDHRAARICTSSAGCSCSSIYGCLSGRNCIAKIPSTSQIELRWQDYSGTLLIWFGSLFFRSFICSSR